jgi:uncharacterized protein
MIPWSRVFFHLRFLAFASVTVLASYPSWTASFDCRGGPVSLAESTICDNPTLSALDSRMASLYSAEVKTHHNLLDSQRAWLRVRNRCPNASCLLAAYLSRVQFLEAMEAKRSKGNTPSNPSTYTPSKSAIRAMLTGKWETMLGSGTAIIRFTETGRVLGYCHEQFSVLQVRRVLGRHQVPLYAATLRFSGKQTRTCGGPSVAMILVGRDDFLAGQVIAMSWTGCRSLKQLAQYEKDPMHAACSSLTYSRAPAASH